MNPLRSLSAGASGMLGAPRVHQDQAEAGLARKERGRNHPPGNAERAKNRLLDGAGFLVAVACLVGVGCRTPNQNPPVPRANTGYVDF